MCYLLVCECEELEVCTLTHHQIGVDFALKVLNWDAKTIIRLQLWDIAGTYVRTYIHAWSTSNYYRFYHVMAHDVVVLCMPHLQLLIVTYVGIIYFVFRNIPEVLQTTLHSMGDRSLCHTPLGHHTTQLPPFNSLPALHSVPCIPPSPWMSLNHLPS